VLGILVCAVSGLRAERAVRNFTAELNALQPRFSHPVRCEIRSQVLGQPVWRRDSLSFVGSIVEGECAGTRLHPGLRVRLYGGPTDLRRGDEIVATVEVGIAQLFRNHDLSDPRLTAARTSVVLSGGVLRLDRVVVGTGLRSRVDAARASVRARIELTYAPDAVGLAKALVLGENDLTDAEDESFKLSGLSHLLAVSGTHLVIAVGTLVAALRQLLLRITPLAARVDVGRVAALAGVPIALVYADFAGGSGSAWRAAWMLSAAYMFQVLGRQASGTRALGLSMIAGFGADALVGFDVSFLLSLAATLGLMTLGRKFAPRGETLHPGVRLFWSSTAATVSAMLPCSVVLALLSARVSWVGILANAVAAPFGEVIALPLCLVHAATSAFPLLERGVALVGSGALLVVRQVALLSARTADFGVPLPLPTAWHYFWISVVIAVGCELHVAAGRQRRAWTVAMAIGACGLVATECRTRLIGNPIGLLRVTALDVGQGDATLVDLPSGALMLIDGGGFVGSPVDPGERVLLPALRARRRSRIDVVVLSHPHPDHFGGLAAVLEKVPVGELWDTGQGERFGAGPDYAHLLRVARAGNISVLRPAELCGSRALGGADVQILAPCPAITEGRGANDNSLVIRIVHGTRSALFVGDAEEVEEHELVARYGPKLQSDLLKVGHHGSRTSSSTQFLEFVRPSVASVSSGMRNRFGHPHAEALERLQTRVSRVVRIDQTGSFVWVTDGQTVHLDGMTGLFTYGFGG
jgi:competence protein ComEC